MRGRSHCCSIILSPHRRYSTRQARSVFFLLPFILSLIPIDPDQSCLLLFRRPLFNHSTKIPAPTTNPPDLTLKTYPSVRTIVPSHLPPSLPYPTHSLYSGQSSHRQTAFCCFACLLCLPFCCWPCRLQYSISSPSNHRPPFASIPTSTSTTTTHQLTTPSVRRPLRPRP